jgi:beta-phosphoglucomutase-like phosphatase (HAD superfamily)
MTRIRAVLFDIDGTLLDSNDAHAHAWLDSLRGHGHNIPFEALRSKIGVGDHRLLLEATGIAPGSLLGLSIIERRLAILRTMYLPDLGPFRGSRVLVDRLRSRGLCCAAISSSRLDEVADLLRAAGVADLMHFVFAADDAEPYPAEKALNHIGVTPKEALVLADTPYDIEASRRAGVSVVALRCGRGWTDGDLADAIAIYDDPVDLSSQLDQSPLALDWDPGAHHPPPKPWGLRPPSTEHSISTSNR